MSEKEKLLTKLEKELTQAIKANEAKRVSVLRLLISELRNLDISKRGTGSEATEEEVIKLLRREVNRRNEAIEMYVKADRQDLINQEKYELEVISEYMPAQMSPEDLDALIDEAIENASPNFGQVMRYVVDRAAGRAEGEVIADLVRQKLGSS